jgi:ATP-dependent 26S proteasome regulatory subunit
MGRHAKESDATFINITASVSTSKRFGESNKLVVGFFKPSAEDAAQRYLHT